MSAWQNEILNAGLAIPVLLIVMIASLTAPAPKKSYRKAALLVMVLAVATMCTVMYMVATAAEQWLALCLAAGAMMMSSLATWLGRGFDPDEGDGGGGSKDDLPDDNLPDPSGADLPEWDWDGFDDKRREWDHQPTQL